MLTYYLITISPMFRTSKECRLKKSVEICFCFRWQHICVTYNSSEEKIDIYANSLVTFSRVNLTALSGHSFHPDLMSRITIGWRSVSSFVKYCLITCGAGEAKARFSQRFSGEFSKLYIWSRALTGLEVDRSYQCGEVSYLERKILSRYCLTSSLLFR